MLPGFYAGLDPATAAQAQGPKWMRRSVRERGWFWDALHDRLSRLANRIDAEARGKIMGAVHARIPMLTVDEREALPKWEAEEELEAWQSLHTGMTEHATDLLETATYLEKSIIRDRESAVALQDAVGRRSEHPDASARPVIVRPSVKLVEITNYGNRHPPPTTHMGQPVPLYLNRFPHPIPVGRLAIAYLEGLITEAESLVP
jgi:hypothetical protein